MTRYDRAMSRLCGLAVRVDRAARETVEAYRLEREAWAAVLAILCGQGHVRSLAFESQYEQPPFVNFKRPD